MPFEYTNPVNEKTYLCLFYKKYCPPIKLNIGETKIRSNKTIGVLGVLFDSKLQRVQRISEAITREKSALNAITLNKKIFY